MSNPGSSSGGLTALGKAVSAILVLGLIGLGVWLVIRPKVGGATGGDGTGTTQSVMKSSPDGAGNGGGTGTPTTFDTTALVDTKTEVPKLEGAQAYVPKNDIFEIELSRYAGYAGLIVANNGLEPNDQSYFTSKYGLHVKITLNEEECAPRLNGGKLGACATTVDVLPLYGRQFSAIVPAQISYSRGADGIVVAKGIKTINDLKGKVVVASQFNESDFFIRYLAHEAGLNVSTMADFNAKPDEESINLVYCKDGEEAAAQFGKAVAANSTKLVGCASWAPFTTGVVEQSKGKAKLLVTSSNLLTIADILVVNKGWADKNADKVAGLVDGLLMGNKMVAENPDQYADLLAKVFSDKDDKWDRKRALAELEKVHLTNLPEEMAFFTGGVTQGGSFASIYESSFLAYGVDLIPSHPSADSFQSLDALKKAQTSGTYAGQVASLVPVKTRGNSSVESTMLLTRDLRFYFKENDDSLDMADAKNLQMLDSVKKLLDVSPGSTVVLVGHVDPGRKPEFMNTGGKALVDKMAMNALDLSERRAKEIKTRLIEREKIDPKRLDASGMGWEKPVSPTDGSLNRRVEVQWFTLE